jgi:hypothetical protein
VIADSPLSVRWAVPLVGTVTTRPKRNARVCYARTLIGGRQAWLQAANRLDLDRVEACHCTHRCRFSLRPRG